MMSIKTFILNIIFFICTKSKEELDSNSSFQSDLLNVINQQVLKINVCCKNNEIVQVEYEKLKDFTAFKDEFKGIDFNKKLDHSLKEIIAGKNFTALSTFSAESFKLFLKIHLASSKKNIKLFIEILEFNNKNEVMHIDEKLFGESKYLVVRNRFEKNSDSSTSSYQKERDDRVGLENIIEKNAPLIHFIEQHFEHFEHLDYKNLIEKLNGKSDLKFFNFIPFILSYLEYRPFEFIFYGVFLKAIFQLQENEDNPKIKQYILKILIDKYPSDEYTTEKIAAIKKLIKLFELQYLDGVDYFYICTVSGELYDMLCEFKSKSFENKNKAKTQIVNLKEIENYKDKIENFICYNHFIQVVIMDLKKNKIEDMDTCFLYYFKHNQKKDLKYKKKGSRKYNS